MSQALNEIERNYEIYDWELLAIMTGLKLWQYYLIDSKFEIWTDHKNLEYFKKPQKLNWQQIWWLSEIQDYNFKLTHKLGSTIKKTNTLSIQLDYD